MNKEKAINIASELNRINGEIVNQLGIIVEFEAIEYCESSDPMCEGCTQEIADKFCWTVKVKEE